MKGEATDGHKFIDKAIAAGAAGIVCESPIDFPHVRVADSAAALNALGIASRSRNPGRIIGVTASAGQQGEEGALFAEWRRAVSEKSVLESVRMGRWRILKQNT